MKGCPMHSLNELRERVWECNMALLEEIARMALLTLGLNPGATSITTSLIRKQYDRKHGSRAYYGQSTASQRRSE
jgi:ribulose-5-phosphate 4-epimerase/fuculose-1-phosphate aldolase